MKGAKLALTRQNISELLQVDSRSISTIFVGDGPWYLAQVLQLLWNESELRQEKLKRAKAETRIAEAEAGERDGTLVNKDDFIREYAIAMVEVRRIIEDSQLPNTEKDKIYGQLGTEFEKRAMDLRRQAATGDDGSGVCEDASRGNGAPSTIQPFEAEA